MLGRYSGAIREGGHRQETGHGLPGAAGELMDAERRTRLAHTALIGLLARANPSGDQAETRPRTRPGPDWQHRHG